MSSVVQLSFQQLPTRSCCADERNECVDAQLEELEPAAAVAVEVVEAGVQAAVAAAAVAFEQLLRRRCGRDFAWN